MSSDRFVRDDEQGNGHSNSIGVAVKDYSKFVIYCMLLAVPLYAITFSIMEQDWVMVFIDALLVPVGFIHGLLLLFGFIS